MTHKVSLNSLVLDFKRTNEGKGVVATRALTTLVAFSLAYSSPLPDNGRTGGLEACTKFVRPLLTNVVSDVNELMSIDLGSIQDLSFAMYCNRYDNVWGGYRALEGFSVKDIVKEGIGEDIWETVMLWADRFVEAITFYLRETKGQA